MSVVVTPEKEETHHASDDQFAVRPSPFTLRILARAQGWGEVTQATVRAAAAMMQLENYTVREIQSRDQQLANQRRQNLNHQTECDRQKEERQLAETEIAKYEKQICGLGAISSFLAVSLGIQNMYFETWLVYAILAIFLSNKSNKPNLIFCTVIHVLFVFSTIFTNPANAPVVSGAVFTFVIVPGLALLWSRLRLYEKLAQAPSATEMKHAREEFIDLGWWIENLQAAVAVLLLMCILDSFFKKVREIEAILAMERIDNSLAVETSCPIDFELFSTECPLFEV